MRAHDPQLREVESPRLDSWKEIASFLHRDARTVRRWERERRLPVHRVPGGERSGVFAYVNELESWLHAASPAAEGARVERRGAADQTSVAVMQAPAAEPGLEDPAEAAKSMDPAEVDLIEPQTAVPLSAFHSLNHFETNFAADAIAESENFASAAQSTTSQARSISGVRRFQALGLLLMLVAVAGIMLGFVQYREVRRVKTTVHRPNPEAQELYLRGRYYWNLRTEEGLNCAVDLFTQSIVNDPHYAEAYAGLADAYLLLRQYGHMPNSEAFPRALAAAKQAIALDDTSPDAHRSIAFILRFWNWDMPAAEREYRRAIELNPNDSLSHHWYATALLSSNRYIEAMAEIDIARKLEPQSVSVLADRGLILSMTDAQAGIASLREVEEAAPSFLSTHTYLAGAYLHVADFEDFLAESRLSAELSHNTAAVAVLEAAQKTLATRGAKLMLRQLATDLAPLADRGAVPAYETAQLFSLAGEPRQAMRYLQLSCDHREPGFLNVGDDRAFELLRSSAEYTSLILRKDVPVGSRQPIARLDALELAK